MRERDCFFTWTNALCCNDGICAHVFRPQDSLARTFNGAFNFSLCSPFWFNHISRVILSRSNIRVTIMSGTFLEKRKMMFRLLTNFLRAQYDHVKASHTIFRMFSPFIRENRYRFIRLICASRSVFKRSFDKGVQSSRVAFAHISARVIAHVCASRVVLTIVSVIYPSAGVRVGSTSKMSFLSFPVPFTGQSVFNSNFNCTMRSTFRVVRFTYVLSFSRSSFTFAIRNFSISTIRLIINTFLITFTFRSFSSLSFFIRRSNRRAIRRVRVNLLTRRALGNPVRTGVPILRLFSFRLFRSFRVQPFLFRDCYFVDSSAGVRVVCRQTAGHGFFMVSCLSVVVKWTVSSPSDKRSAEQRKDQ